MVPCLEGGGWTAGPLRLERACGDLRLTPYWGMALVMGFVLECGSGSALDAELPWMCWRTRPPAPEIAPWSRSGPAPPRFWRISGQGGVFRPPPPLFVPCCRFASRKRLPTGRRNGWRSIEHLFGCA